jgi:tetratricopeptide (TPR) repeat protein
LGGKLKTYINELAPWEKKKEHYRNIQLGKEVKIQKGDIKSQATEMITSQIASTNAIIASKNIRTDTINDLTYDMESIENGIYGIKAAFEWGISDVVWQIEQDTEKLKEILELLYVSSDKIIKNLRWDAEEDYGSGKIDHALHSFRELLTENQYDFSVHMSMGIIYLFHKIDKEKALSCFDKAIRHAGKLSAAYYTSYALLYKALIKRDYGLIEEAEELTNQAIKTLPNFTEAVYQNAQYNALLNKPDKVIPLLKKAINDDIIYCLKINNEKDFDGMRSQINKLFEEVRDEKNEKVKHKQTELEEKAALLDSTITYIMEIGYDIPEAFHVKSLKEKNTEAANTIANNSIFDASIADLILSLSNKRLQHNEAKLKDKCREIKEDLENEIHELNIKLSEVKKKGNFLYFFLYLLAGQIVVIPIGLSMETFSGIYIAEAVLLALCLYWNIILPRSRWERIYALLKDKEDKLDQIVKRIGSIDQYLDDFLPI